ncbi:MAG: hypothetical protein OEY28_14650 [Nitrospira sp.]|nr:hypothetical protein [Nitrospira sp.]
MGWIRNLLIFAGLAGGGWFAVSAAIEPSADKKDDKRTARGEQRYAVIEVAGEATPAPDIIPIVRPLSIESAFGRSLLTGEEGGGDQGDPLEMLDIDRTWDVVLALPEPVTDLRREIPRASDEVEEREPVASGRDLKDLPDKVRELAENAKELIEEALTMMRASAPNRPEWNEVAAEAAGKLGEARDLLTKALDAVPEHRAMLDLMREAKAALYAANKSRR